jgi:hypothetical protein
MREKSVPQHPKVPPSLTDLNQTAQLNMSAKSAQIRLFS